MTNSKLVVFRRGGIVKNIGKWIFIGKEIEVVPMYKYLELIFTPKINCVTHTTIWSRDMGV